MGENYISAMPSMQELHRDEAIGYDSRYLKDESNGAHVTCTTYRIAAEENMDVL